MKKMLAAMCAALEREERVVLVAILAAEGSAPRAAGAKMAVFADETSIGTIGGGAVELEAAQLAKMLLSMGGTAVRRFALHPAQEDQVNMICGGEVTVFFHCFRPDDAAAVELLRRWLRLLEEEKSAYLRLSIKTGEPVLQLFETLALLHDAAVALSPWNGEYCVEKIESRRRVLLFGGGHVGQALVPVLDSVGFRVWVIDEREEIARMERFPRAERVLREDFLQLSGELLPRAEDFVVVMTSGHQADYDILRQILPCDCSYVGCIGSRKKAAAVREKLAAAGVAAARIEGVHSPIGLSIGAQTPEEIAISIAAEMIACRANCVKE